MDRKIQCCICGVQTPINPDAMCLNCLKTRVDITEDLPSQVDIYQCRECARFHRPPWVVAPLESPELLQLCLRKINGLSKFRLIDTKFIWTEPHSKRVQVQVTVQKEVLRGTNIQQDKVIEFVVQNLQCDDCKKTYTPHKWVANVQIRQRTNPPRSLYAFEQIVLQHKAHARTLKIKQKDSGLDFHFGNKSDATSFVGFVQSYLPIVVKTSKQLISQDDHTNTHNHKYTFSVEVVPVSRNDLVVLPPVLGHALGSVLALCFKVTSVLHLVDPNTSRVLEVGSDKYWRDPFPAQATPSNLIEFIVLDVEEPRHAVPVLLEEDSVASTNATRHAQFHFSTVDVEVARVRDLGYVDKTYHIRSHLGTLLHAGDTVLGYDLENMTLTCRSEELVAGNFPDVILVKKISGNATRPKEQLEVAGRSGRQEEEIQELEDTDEV